MKIICFKALALGCAVPIFMALVACGDDSGSGPSKDGSEQSNQDVLDTVPHESSFDSLNVGEFYDSKSGNTYALVRFKTYQWLMSDIHYDTFSAGPMCYDLDDANCENFGMLYRATKAEKACPEGFEIPSEQDWKELKKHRSSLDKEQQFGMNVRKAGFCSEADDGELSCQMQGSKSFYLTANNTVFVTNDGLTGSFAPAENNGFYSLRCISRTYIVKSVKNLPTCDSSSQMSLGEFYVTDAQSNYRCNGSYKWVDNFNSDCEHVRKGYTSVVNDTTYICKYGSWEIAEIDDVDLECGAANDGSTTKFNGVDYVCQNDSWRKFTATEIKLGLCNAEALGFVGSIKNDKYYCDSTGWRKASFEDIVEECNKEKEGQYIPYNGDYYGCNNTGWVRLSDIEIEFGFCTSKIAGALDTLNEVIYVCNDSLRWRAANLVDVYGKCTETRNGDSATFNENRYACADTSWRAFTTLEKTLGKICYSKRFGSLEKDGYNAYYVCDSTGWHSAGASDISKVHGECTADRAYDIVDWTSGGNTSPTRYYCSTSGTWSVSSTLEQKIGLCQASNRGEFKVYNGSNYMCDSTGWRTATDKDFLGKCDNSNLGATKKYISKYYGCSEKGWVVTTALNWSIGTMCMENFEGKTATYAGASMVCNGSNWVLSGDLTQALGACDEINYGKLVNGLDGQRYFCNGTSWAISK